MIEEGEATGVSHAWAAAAVQDLLSPFITMLPVSGASITVASGPGHSTLGATDPLASRLEQLQFELGEGPHWSAVRSGEPVLVPSLHESGSSWPVFAAAARTLDVEALFAFPLTLGAATVGVVDLHRTSAGPLTGSEVATARSLASIASAIALGIAARSASAREELAIAPSPELRRVVHQATGMVLVQLDITATEALARLRAHAFASGTPLESVASDVVARRLRFDDRASE
ncbi:GAF and ANTAR domain-containing protein [Agrococcus sp. ProA11]|uniref:GAF and ANTAR domain-containing protein n=1 Tax=Agrococcus chionoecetis TaxID=3153752 RepID=UPI0032606E26